jgi:hypothetical protein
MYRPNFCTSCGNNITHARWRFWNSRRFCPDCARRFRKRRVLLPLLACAAIFGLGLSAGRLSRRQPAPLVLEQGASALGPVSTPALKSGAQAAGPKLAQDGSAQPKPETTYGPDGSASERPTDPNEVISVCGARTKKGTPCQRRVRGTGRCWQHKGMPAIIRNTVVN